MRFRSCNPKWRAKFFIAQRFHPCHSGVLLDGTPGCAWASWGSGIHETKPVFDSKSSSEAVVFSMLIPIGNLHRLSLCRSFWLVCITLRSERQDHERI